MNTWMKYFNYTGIYPCVYFESEEEDILANQALIALKLKAEVLMEIPDGFAKKEGKV